MAILLLCVGVIAVLAWRRSGAQAAEIEQLAARLAALESRGALGSDPKPAVSQPALAQPALAPPPPVRPPVVASPPPVRPVVASPPERRPVAPIPQVVGTTPVPKAAQVSDTGTDPKPMPAPVAARTADDSLETRIGARWLLYIGVAAIVIGVSYFEKLAIDNHWINETARTIQAGVFGAVLVYVGLRFTRAGYTLYGQMISGGGVAVLYVATYAAFNLYHLINRPTAFVLMAAITALASLLADRQRSQGLALMAVGGGFATPFLLPGDGDAEIALFTYEAILIAGTMFLAHRRVWPLLNVVSYGFTVLTVLGWQAQFYEPSKYLTTELFLTLFCAMYLYVLRELRRSTHPQARIAKGILATAPAGYYLASLAILTPHGTALLVYLVALALVGAVAGKRVGAAARLVCWFAVAAPLLVWVDSHGGRTWLTTGLAAVFGIYIINLLADFERMLRDDKQAEPSAILLLHLNGLASYGCAHVLINGINSAAAAPFAAGFGVWHAAVAVALLTRRREMAMHFAALAGSLLAIAVSLQFQGAAAIAGWAAEGAAIVWLGLRERRDWFRLGGIGLFAFALIRLIELQVTPAPVGQIVLLNSKAAIGAFVIALAYVMTWLHERAQDRPARATDVGIGLVTAKLLILSTAAAEINDYWLAHAHGIFEPAAQLIMAALIVGSVIVWLALFRRQEWMRVTGALLVGIGLASLLSIQFVSAPPNYVVALNGRVAAGILAIAVLYLMSRLQTRLGGHLTTTPMEIAIYMTSASLFTLSLLTSEIDAYWAARGAADVWSIAREGLQAIVWSAIGSLVVWIGVQRQRGWIRGVGAVVLVIGISRLLQLQFAAAPAGYVVLANTRLIASLFVIAALYGLARLYRGSTNPLDAGLHPRTVLFFAANALSLTMLTSEITAFWHVRDLAPQVTSASRDSHFARELTLSITWAAYATALIVAGLRKNYAPIRYFGITLFAVTIVKVFGFDMAELDRIYRVSSIIVLGVLLLATSYLYNRFRGDLMPGEREHDHA